MGGGLVLMGDNREVRGAPPSQLPRQRRSKLRDTNRPSAIAHRELPSIVKGMFNVQCSEEVAPHATVGFGLRLSFYTCVLPFLRKKQKNDVQHIAFPRGPPPQYYRYSRQLNFAVRMGSGDPA
jgi:hypothetical protein